MGKATKITLIFLPCLNSSLTGFKHTDTTEEFHEKTLVIGSLDKELLGKLLLCRQKAKVTDKNDQITNKSSKGQGGVISPHKQKRNDRDTKLTREPKDHLGHQGIKMLDIANSADDLAASMALKISNRQTQQPLAIMHDHLKLQLLAKIANHVALEKVEKATKTKQKHQTNTQARQHSIIAT